MTKPKLTVLTDPMPWGREMLHESARRSARWLRDAFRLNQQYFNHPRYRGHFAVTRSLIEGLQSIGVSFNYNPKFPWAMADTVIVLAGVRTLRQAIRLKQQGQIRRLLAGPNIVVFSSDFDSIITSVEIDSVITPSDYVVDLYLEDHPSLNGRIFSWPAGVDIDYWMPNQKANSNRILVFDKRGIDDDPERVKPYVDFLQKAGWHVDVLQRCGRQSYTHEKYLKLLQKSCLLVGFTVGSESQGIAWAEAWSADVPTLILRNTSNVYRGRRYTCSTAPYLHPRNGLFFDDLEDFKIKFSYWEACRDHFTPRAWTLENMSDEVCAAMLYKRVIEC